MKKGDTSELVLNHRVQGEKLAWRMLNRWRVRLSRDEVSSVVGIALCEAASRYDSKKGATFITFFFYHLRGMLIKEVTRRLDDLRRQRTFIDGERTDTDEREDTYYSTSWQHLVVNNVTPEDLVTKNEIQQLVLGSEAELSNLEQEVINRHFVLDQSLTNIAGELGYCRCHISRVKKQALARLKSALEPRRAELWGPPKAAPLAERKLAAKRKKRTSRSAREGTRTHRVKKANKSAKVANG